MLRVCVLTPQPLTLQPLVEALTRDSMEVTLVHYPEQSFASSGSPQLLLIAVSGPDWKQLASEFVATFIESTDSQAWITAVWVIDGEAEDREEVLALGFDQAFTGTLSAIELSSRLRALARRLGWRKTKEPPPKSKNKIGLELDHLRSTVSAGGEAIKLTATEFAVMKVLLGYNEYCPRDVLMKQVYGEQATDHGRALDNVILRLRRRLAGICTIRTLHGRGHRINPP